MRTITMAGLALLAMPLTVSAAPGKGPVAPLTASHVGPTRGDFDGDGACDATAKPKFKVKQKSWLCSNFREQATPVRSGQTIAGVSPIHDAGPVVHTASGPPSPRDPQSGLPTGKRTAAKAARGPGQIPCNINPTCGPSGEH